MPYQLRADETVQDGVRRCAREELDHAVGELTTGVHTDPVEAVHAARKDLKKARSLLRLTRAAIDRDQRRRENKALRDAGRALSASRDAEVMLQALDNLADRFAGQVAQTTFEPIRRHLEAERDTARQRMIASGLPGQTADELKSVRARIDEWPIRRGGWKALEPGLLRSYRRGCKALAIAQREPTVEALHEWRKRSKDLWYHLRMLEPLSPGIVGGQAEEAHALSDLLGDDHDLAILRDTLGSSGGRLAVDLDAVTQLIDRRREQLQAEAFRVGARLYAESPKAFGRRLHGYWKVWRPAAALT
ncbi:MAG: CHAD domain-containing protein [Solirubrobacterales bacterium]|nr:CHAD domain-containing protein [Solirubrobacterales bacterium]